MFGKKVCFYCGEKSKSVNMSKTKDNFYLCMNCLGLISRYYPGCFASTREEMMSHLEYMKKMREVYENDFLTDDERITIKNQNLGISVSLKTGLFKVIDNEWGEFNNRADIELFRLDQINRYEVFCNYNVGVYINNNAFIDSGVKIYMNNVRKESYNKYKPAENQSLHPYVYELNVVTAAEEKLTPADTVEINGIKVSDKIKGLLDDIFGTTKAEMAEKRYEYGLLADKYLARIVAPQK